MSQPYVGEIRMFAGSFAPNGWAFCNGQTMAISDNQVLFQLLGTTYGGDGQQTFQLPNLQGRAPIHFGQDPGASNYVQGQVAGTENVTLTNLQLPSHSHTPVGGSEGNQVSPQNNYWSSDPGGNVAAYDTTSAGQMSAAAIGMAGNSQPHTNIQPRLVISYIISLFGVFPSQS